MTKAFIILSSLPTRFMRAENARAATVTFIELFGVQPDMVYQTQTIESVKALRDFDTMVSS